MKDDRSFSSQNGENGKIRGNRFNVGKTIGGGKGRKTTRKKLFKKKLSTR